PPASELLLAGCFHLAANHLVKLDKEGGEPRPEVVEPAVHKEVGAGDGHGHPMLSATSRAPRAPGRRPHRATGPGTRPAGSVRLQIYEIRAKRPRRMPESRVAGAKENPGGAPGDPRPFKGWEVDAAANPGQVGDEDRSDEPFRGQAIDPGPTVEEMDRRVNVGTGV